MIEIVKASSTSKVYKLTQDKKYNVLDKSINFIWIKNDENKIYAYPNHLFYSF